MTNRINLGLFIHNHQPVGNYDSVFAELWQKSYRPMLAALESHPRVRPTLHYSGPLIEWLDANRPEFKGMLGKLVERGQVELAGGGWYEPILAMLPEADRVGQIRLMARELHRRWGVRPAGLWLTERVWEPGLASTLAAAGVDYTLVDDSHFAGVGLSESNLDGYFLTEDGGPPVAIFPGLQSLRRKLPWRPVREVMDWLAGEAERAPGRLLTMGDDGEKFGGWPQTYFYCWEEDGGWVENFFRAVESSDWLETVPLGEWRERQRSRGPAYLPTGSYQEMEEWALPETTQVEREEFRAQARGRGLEAPPLRAGYWRNFLVRYPEVAAMRQRALRVRSLLDGAESGRRAAERELWRGQCNCSYWHGIFGGLYLRHIRTATLRHLVAAETLAHEAAGTMAPLVSRADMDLDGKQEVILRTAAQQVLVDPSEGGAILEWDLVDPPWALLSVVARRPEAYHQILAKGEARSISPGAGAQVQWGQQPLAYDNVRRAAAQEALVPGAQAASSALAQAISGQWTAEALDLAAAEWRELRAGRARSPRIVLEVSAGEIRVRKTIRLAQDSPDLGVSYEVTNCSRERWAGWLVSRWNVGLPDRHGGPGAEQVRGEPPEVRVDAGGDVVLVGRVTGFEAVADGPVETVSSSERGVEVTYQGRAIALGWALSLAPGKAARAELSWTIETPARKAGKKRRGGRAPRPSRG